MQFFFGLECRTPLLAERSAHLPGFLLYKTKIKQKQMRQNSQNGILKKGFFSDNILRSSSFFYHNFAALDKQISNLQCRI